METESYTGETTYDALGRPVIVTTPDGGLTIHTYNQAGQLYSLGVEDIGGSLTTEIINEIYYNARGQRTKVKYRNGATATYSYDPNTFRVTRIRTTRASDSEVLQDLNYWYDPVGNITWQTDDALDVIFYDGTMAEPTNKYTYDALYRLLKCEGREHAGSDAAANHDDNHRVGIAPLPSDAGALRRYTQLYTYDETGNMKMMKHITSGTGSWTRTFTIDSTTNKLNVNDIGSDNGSAENYTYDARGNMNLGGMNHIGNASYNDLNQLYKVADTADNTTYYQYDHAGQRVRKYTLPGSGHVAKERKYIGGWEQYREINTTTLAIEVERETLNVMDDTARVAVIDTPTIPPPGELQTLRYQFSNHLGTASLELDVDAYTISYEEYYPFGNTSYKASNGGELSMKRYRYVGKERDDESGFYYIGARYYCPWLARWLEPDPINNEWYNLTFGCHVQKGVTHTIHYYFVH